MQYSVWVVSPEGYPHSACFSELAASLNAALIELGHQSQVVTEAGKILGRPVVLGAHLFDKIHEVSLPDNTIIFNTEQIGEGFADNEDYLELLSKGEVWDYSQINIDALKARGINAKLCEIGYMPVLTDLPSAFQDIDVVFCGSLNERRKKILSDLKDSGVGIVPIIGYGHWRNGFLARAKIVLNMHFYDAKIFEVVRCSHLMANSKCIVSERGLDKELEGQYEAGIAFAEYDGLVGRVKELLADKVERERIGTAGFKIFSQKRQTDILKNLIGETL